jgi:ribonucleoside-diphosphate reductase alpha chain
LQAGYDQFDYLGDVTTRIVRREALLGVSITGMQDSPDILFDSKLQRKMAKMILKVNEIIAVKIGVNKCARATCVKPAGTTSCILGTASGIHAHHARRYIRRSQANYLEAPCRHFKEVNPTAVEKSVWSANGTDEVIAFCVEVPKGAKIKNDLDAITLLEHVKLTQQNWVTAGTREEACTQPWLKHNVSNTITVRDGEWEEVTKYIFKNRRHFAGISLLPQSGDKDYPQAPFTAIYTPTELAKMYGDGMPMASGLVVDGLHEFDNNLWVACEEALGITNLPEPDLPNDPGDHGEQFAYEKKRMKWLSKKDWCRRVQQFADRYLEGDAKQATYLMKDVHNWKLWCDLKREYKNVDYTTLFEESDETKVSETIACAGGACDVSYA